MDAVLNRLVEILGPLAKDNTIIVGLCLSALALLALLWIAPMVDWDAILARSGSREAGNFTSRMLYQLRRVRSDDAPLRKRIGRYLFPDGNTSGELQMDHNDFFMFLRLVVSSIFAFFAALLVLVLGLDPIFFVILPTVGYLLPGFIGGMHNRLRRGKIQKALPKAAVRLRTRIGAEARVPDALTKAAEDQEGPLWDEMRWAARQMVDQNPYPFIRELDRRNNLTFFAPLAIAAENAGKRSREDERRAFVEYLDRKRDEFYAEKEEKLGKLTSKVSALMIPFLFLGLLAAAMAPVIVNMVNGSGFTGL